MSIVNYSLPLRLEMTTKRLNIQELGVNIEYTIFAPEGKLEEIHALLHVTDRESDFATQYHQLLQAQQQFIKEVGGAKIMMKRYFVSDATNQMPLIEDLAEHVSVIQQPPLDGTKVAAWLYLHKGDSNYQHVWKMNQIVPEGDSYHQSRTLLERYEEELKERYDANIAEHCIRTWFFVRDVDTQYKGLVVARRENFEAQGLTNKTHYLASTGIHGIPADTNAIVQMDTYMVKGLEPTQQTYLYARTHLNPTYEYGVTFERGVKLTYGDRTHLLISGTASINNKGEVVHVGDLAIFDLFKKDSGVDSPPKHLLPLVYESTLCSCCRETAVRLMGRYHMMTPELWEEQMHDSSDEIRKAAEAHFRRIPYCKGSRMD